MNRACIIRREQESGEGVRTVSEKKKGEGGGESSVVAMRRRHRGAGSGDPRTVHVVVDSCTTRNDSAQNGIP